MNKKKLTTDKTSEKINTRARTRKNIARLTDEQRARLPELRDKEVGQFLMPDAPPSKNRRTVSPVSMPCPSIPTLEGPRLRIRQPWELEKLALDANGPSRVELVEDGSVTPPPPKGQQIAAEVGGAVAGPLQPTPLFAVVPPPAAAADLAVAAPSRPLTLAQEYRIVREKRAVDKKKLARLPAEQRTRLLELRSRKEVGCFLMPDAPPRRRRRNVSPDRVPCPLVAGTPEVPPPRVPQRWELQTSVLDASGPSRVELVEDGSVTPPPSQENQMVFIPSTGALDEAQEVGENHVSIEYIGFSPSTSFSTECPTLQDFSPGPSTSSTIPVLDASESRVYLELEELEQLERAVATSPPPQREASPPPQREATPPPPPTEFHPLVLTPSTGVITVGEGEEVDESLSVANVELVGFSPSASSSAERCSPELQNMSPGPSTSSARPDFSMFELDLGDDILQWQRSAGLNPGSDVEEEDCLDLHPRRRQAGEFDVEDLSSELYEALGSMHRQDDCVLRESSQEDMLQFDWSHDPDVFTGVRESFTGPAGPTFPIVGLSPFQILSKIWDKDIINLIVDETNKYAAALLRSASLPQRSRMRKWTPITPQDLWTFLGVIMLQSIVPVPVEEEYWSPCLPYLKVGNFTGIMPLHRFLLIKRCLHFVDNALCARGISSKLVKIQPVIDHLNSKFSSLYLPEQEIALDESLMLWKGRLSFAQLIASKAAKVGIKSYELCESKTGYLWQMIIYTGKKAHQEQHDAEDLEGTDEAEPENVSSKIVMNLVTPLLHRGHTLVMDNFYNSPLLTRTLKLKQTDVMGTLRLNREFVPDSLRTKNKTNMRAGEVAFSQTRDMTITVWNDAAVVGLISTYHRVEVGGKEKYGYFRYKPKVVLDYNLAMGGVDKKDQLLQAFPIERVRNSIWYKKLFRRLFNVSIHNAFVMAAKAGTAKMAQRQFRVRLADEIIQRFRPQNPELLLPAAGHFPIKSEAKKSRCKWCTINKLASRTVFKCDTCHVSLCIVGCFRAYHVSRGFVR